MHLVPSGDRRYGEIQAEHDELDTVTVQLAQLEITAEHAAH